MPHPEGREALSLCGQAQAPRDKQKTLIGAVGGGGCARGCAVGGRKKAERSSNGAQGNWDVRGKSIEMRQTRQLECRGLFHGF